MRNTQMYYMIEYLQRMASMMLNTRLSDLAKTPECDYAQARVSIGDFFLAKTKGALTLDVIAKNENSAASAGMGIGANNSLIFASM